MIVGVVDSEDFEKPRHRRRKGYNFLYFRTVQMVFLPFCESIMIDRTVAGRRWLVIDGNQELRSPLYLRRVFLFLVLSTVLCIIEFVPSVSPAETLYFPRGNLPLQEVVSRAAPGDTIIVAPGIYSFFYESLTIINETLQIKSSHGPE